MPKQKTAAKKRSKIHFGTLAFVGIFIVAYAAIWFPANVSEALLLVAVLGMAVAIFNMRGNKVSGMHRILRILAPPKTTFLCVPKASLSCVGKTEEKNFLIAITALLISIITISVMLGPISMLSVFMTYLAVGFGVAGIITAFYMIIRLGIDY